MELKVNKKLGLFEKLIIFDTETFLKPENDVLFYHDLYLIVGKFKRSWNDNGYFKVYSRLKDKMFVSHFNMDILKFMGRSKNMMIIAHNCLYDFITSHMYYSLRLNDWVLDSFSDGNPFFMIWKKGKKTIFIQDNINYFMGKLEKWGKVVGCKKWGDFNYDDESELNQIRAIDYCKNDVEIIDRLLIMLCNFLVGNFSGVIGGKGNFFTIAGLSYKIFMLKYEPYIEGSIFSCIEMERESYGGGRCECFRLGSFKECCYIDVNSMYPTVMIENKLPYAYCDDLIEFNHENLDKYACIAKVFIWGVTNDNRVIGVHRNNKYVFPQGNFNATVTTGELIWLLNEGIGFEIIQIQWYFKDFFIRDYIESSYNRRLESQSKEEKTLYKLMMNSLYGKFAQKGKSFEAFEKGDDIKRYNMKDEDGKLFLVKELGGNKFRYEETDITKNTAVYISSHITAYARLMIWKYINMIGYENCYYTDTDSIVFNMLYLDRIKDFLDDTKLGYFKVEHMDFEFRLFGLKDYEIWEGEKVIKKLKGIKKDSVRMNDSLWKIHQWGKLNYYIKEGQMKNYKSFKILKKLSRNYTKGIVKEDVVNGFMLDEKIGLKDYR